MKITWFGGTTLRVYYGGKILVGDVVSAPAGIDQTELISGADRVFSLVEGANDLPPLPGDWTPARPRRMIDEGEADRDARLWRIGLSSVLVEGGGEAPLLLLSTGDRHADAWPFAEGAVAVLAGPADGATDLGRAILAANRLRLVALAIPEGDADAVFNALAPHLGGAALQLLEPGLALEA